MGGAQKTIFIVDDSYTNLHVAKEALSEDYKIITMASAEKMFLLLQRIRPDLILLDIEMPEMNGIEALRQLKADVRKADIPVVFLTSTSDRVVEALGFELGAVDFLRKPFSKPVLLRRIKSHLEIDGLIRKQTARLQRLQNGMISVIAEIIENRDEKTGGHVERTAAYIRILVGAMQPKGMYEEMLLNIDIDSFVSSARLHDVGKVVVSDVILNKPDKLSPEEYEVIKRHASMGEKIIDDIISITGDVMFLNSAKLFAGYHHERWDGTGYPRGLNGADIPFQGRIMALADVYDALVSARPYKNPIPHENAVDIIMQGKGAQFDPLMADVFYEVREQFEAISLMI